MLYESMETAKKMRYILNMSPVLNKDAMFSDGTEYYRTPVEPREGDTVTIRFRTQRNNVDNVCLVHDGEYLEMKREKTSGSFDYYTAQIVMGKDLVRYYFEIHSGLVTCYYDTNGVSTRHEERTEFEIYPGYHVPEWLKGAVMYQIYVDRFCNGDPSNDVETGEYFYIGDTSVKVDNWEKVPAVMGVREFYGGDLQGVMDKLDYLQELGVDVIYLNPVFVSPSNHKYDCQDYDHIDPHIGRIVADCDGLLSPGDSDNSHALKYIRRVTDKRNLEASNKLFQELVEEIHRRGMKVILDGVFNHCGSFNKWMDRERIYENQEGYEKGAYVSADSPYRSFFCFQDQNRWPYNPTYDGWWTHDTLPKLNYEESEELCRTILDVGRKWVSPPYNVDGWRLDVAADLGHSNDFNHHFWKEFRRTVKEANPEAVILAEHYGNPESWLRGDEWDTVMNYDAFMEPVTWFLTGMEKHSDEFNQGLLGNSESFIGAMPYHMPAFYAPSLYTAMNELDNHDHSRFLTRTNHRVGRVANVGPYAAAENTNKAVLREAVVIQMTWPGAPTLYYGDEAGQVGFTDPDNRRTYPWGQEDQELIRFYKEMIAVHRRFPVLAMGSLKFLCHDYNVLSYGRFNQEEQVIVIINNRNERVHVEIPVWLTGINRSSVAKLTQVFATDAVGFSSEEKEIEAPAGILEMDLLPLSGVVLHRCEE